MIVRLTTIETSSATVSARLSDWKNCPTTPRTKASGRKTRIVVSVEPITAPLISRLARSTASSPVSPFGQVPRDVLDHDHRVVDDQADGHGQAAQRHQVERVARQVQEDEADDQAQRIDNAAISVARTLFRNKKQDDTLKRPPIDDGVADVGDRGPDQQALVVDGLDLHAGRGTLGGVGQHVFKLARDGQGVAAQPAKDGQGHGVLAVGADRHRAVFVGDRHPAQVAEPDRLAVLLGDDDVLQVERVGRQGVGQHLVLQRPAVEPADGLEPMLLAQTIGHVGDRQAGRHQRLGLDLDQDLADVAPLHGHVGDVGDAADPRPQIVIGVVVQRRRVAAAGDDERDDRKNRRRLPLDDRAGAGRQLCADLGHRARTSFRAWTMSVPGAKSIDSSAAPRTDFERTRTTPSTMLTTSSIGRVTATSTSLTARPGVWAMTTIRGKATSG